METVEDPELAWALENLLEDEKDEVTLIKNVLDSLKSYINPEAFEKELEMRKNKEKNTVMSPYVRTLMERGATLEEALGE